MPCAALRPGIVAEVPGAWPAAYSCILGHTWTMYLEIVRHIATFSANAGQDGPGTLVRRVRNSDAANAGGIGIRSAPHSVSEYALPGCDLDPPRAYKNRGATIRGGQGIHQHGE